MVDGRSFLDDVGKIASEAGSTLVRAGEKALDRLDTWRLEQDANALVSELGQLVYGIMISRVGDTGDNHLQDNCYANDTIANNSQVMSLISKIRKLREEIEIRKATTGVSEEI